MKKGRELPHPNSQGGGRYPLRDSQGSPIFIDLFAGAGGLSLGLLLSGWRGLFAVEQNPQAFATLKYNLIDHPRSVAYTWPEWLPQEPLEVGAFIETYLEPLSELRGKVDLLAGGPPCQGFSTAGRRRVDDPRNQLFRHYVHLARILRPKLLFFENVPGIAVRFAQGDSKSGCSDSSDTRPYSEIISEALLELGYSVFSLKERAVDFGVPQTRPRYLIFGALQDSFDGITLDDLRNTLFIVRDLFLLKNGLELSTPVTVGDALSDLKSLGRRLIECVDSPGFKEIVYQGPVSQFQRILRVGMDDSEAPNSLRLAKHRSDTQIRFEDILASCRKGVKLSNKDRERLGVRKNSITPLDDQRPAHTLTSIPDDFVHYDEPRILTVRECARLQSFPDWYAFQGKYTTGGERRKHEVPRYTQVANAVPPFLGQIVGHTLQSILREYSVNRGKAFAV